MFLTPSDSLLESRITSLTGGPSPLADRAWDLFLSHSPYSPLSLGPILNWEPTLRDLPGLAGIGLWLEVKRLREQTDAWADEFTDRGTSFFEGVGGVVKTLGKVLEDEVEWLRQRRANERDKECKEEDRKRSTPPEHNKDAAQTEGDLYSVVQSAFHESERSLSNFFKSISDGWRDGSLLEPKPASPPKTETSEVVENGVTKKTTRKEYVDRLGNTHSKVETTWTDEAGRVVMKQSHSSVNRSVHWEKSFEKSFGGEKQDKSDRDTTEEPKDKDKEREQHKHENGWFWK
ncbi:hypothetical protein N0V88_005836 [Collariella sp. IMI 366227]|nr:hypothetical protein N0V88_005836 [Collariella sp. IMI 366227]